MKSFARGRKKKAVRPPGGQQKLPETEDSDAFETLFAGALGENGLPGLELPHDIHQSGDGDSEESLRFVRGDAREGPSQESPGAHQRANSPTFSFADPSETRRMRRDGGRLNEGKRGDSLKDLSDGSVQGSTTSGATPVSTLRFASSDEDDVAAPQSIKEQEGQQRHERRTHRVVGAPPGLPTNVDLTGVRDWNDSAEDTQENRAFNIVVEDFDALAKARDKDVKPKQFGLPSDQDSNIWKERYFKLKDEYDALSTAHANVLEQYRRVSAEVSKKNTGMPSKTSTSSAVDLALQQAKDKIAQQNEEIQALLEQRIAVEAELAELRFSSVGRDAADASIPHDYNELKKALRIKDQTIEALKGKLKQASGEVSTSVKKKKKGWFGSSSSSKKSDSQKQISAPELEETQATLAEAQIENTQRLVELERENAKLSAQAHLLQQDKTQIEEKLEALQLQLELLIQKKAADEAALRDAITRAPPPFPIPEGPVPPGSGDKSASHWEVMFQLQQAATEKLSLKNQQLEDMLNTYAKSTTNLKKKTNTPGLSREESTAPSSPEELEALRNEVRNLQERVAEKDRQVDVSNTALLHQKEEIERRNEVTQTEIARLRDKLNCYRTMIGNLLTRQGDIRDRLADTQKRYLQDVQEYQSEVRALRDGREARCPQATNPPNHRVRTFASFGVRVAGSRSQHLKEEQNPEVSSRTAPAQLQSTYTPDNFHARTETSKANECTSVRAAREDQTPVIGSGCELRTSVEKRTNAEPTAPEPEAPLSSQNSIMSHNSCASNKGKNMVAQTGQGFKDTNGLCSTFSTLETQPLSSEPPLSRPSIRPVVVVEVNDPSVSPAANAVRGLDDLAVPVPIVTDADRALALASLKRWVKNGRCTKNALSCQQSPEQRMVCESSNPNKPRSSTRAIPRTSDVSLLRGPNHAQPTKSSPLIPQHEAYALGGSPNTAAPGYLMTANGTTSDSPQEYSKCFFPDSWTKQPSDAKEPIPKIPLPVPVTAHQSFKAHSLTPNPGALDPTKRKAPTLKLNNPSLLPSSGNPYGNTSISLPPDTWFLKEAGDLLNIDAAYSTHADIPQNDALLSEGNMVFHHPGSPCAPASANMSPPEVIPFVNSKATSQPYASEAKTGASRMPQGEEVGGPTRSLQRIDPAMPSPSHLEADHQRRTESTYETKLPHTSSPTKDITLDAHFLTRADSNHSSPHRYHIRGGTVENLIHDLDQEQDTSHMQHGRVARDYTTGLKNNPTKSDKTTFQRPTGHLNALKEQSDSWDELASDF